MKRVLVDSSVWIDYFNGNDDGKILSDLIDNNLIVINNIILAELTPQLKIRKEDELIRLLNEIENIPLTIDWDEIIDFQVINIRNGVNRMGIPDLLIVQNIKQNDLDIYTNDKHFLLMEKVLKIKIFG